MLDHRIQIGNPRGQPNRSRTVDLAAEQTRRKVGLQRERARRGTEVALLDCLQLGDKIGVLVRDPEVLAALGFRSRGAAKPVIKDLQSLRNHLAHAQDIVSHDWTQIVRLARRLDADGAS